jgi:Ni/Fe-hydrogenase subunit HybB-like protein
LTVYKMELLGVEGLAMTVGLLALPLLILWVLVKVLPPWADAEERSTG